MPPDDECEPGHLESQRDRFESQSSDYSRHHLSSVAQEYRSRFIRKSLFPDEMKGLRVLDAMCGGGEETGAMIAVGAQVEGLDLASEFARKYTERWNRPCRVANIAATGYKSDSFDLVYVCGGFHHVRPQLTEVVDEIHRILRVGGHLILVEPNRDSWADLFRRIWYRFDRRFTAEEAAISVESDLLPLFEDKFVVEHIHQGGSLAYLLTAQSFILRFPQRLTSCYAPLLFWIEERLQGTVFDPRLFICGRFHKVESGVST